MGVLRLSVRKDANCGYENRSEGMNPLNEEVEGTEELQGDGGEDEPLTVARSHAILGLIATGTKSGAPKERMAGRAGGMREVPTYMSIQPMSI